MVLPAAWVTLPVARASSVENPIFGYTHLLPSPFTVPAGRLVFGTDLSYGVTDFLQVGTNILRDFYKAYNAGAKVSLIDAPVFAMAATIGYETYNYRDISKNNPDLRVSAWQPGLVMSNEILPGLALFYGANLNLASTTFRDSGVETSGYVHGAQLGSDLSWAYNPPTKKKSVGIGNVLSTGVTYDVSYDLFGIGLSHHWPGFHVGLHYYPSATEYRVQPILAGGGSIDF